MVASFFDFMSLLGARVARGLDDAQAILAIRYVAAVKGKRSDMRPANEKSGAAYNYKEYFMKLI
jgi:hypothetical protein